MYILSTTTWLLVQSLDLCRCCLAMDDVEEEEEEEWYNLCQHRQGGSIGEQK